MGAPARAVSGRARRRSPLTRPAKAVSLSSVRRFVNRLAACLAALTLAGCGSDSGTPTLDPSIVSVEGESLVPISGRICHVRGTVVNATPDVPVTVILRWLAYDPTDTGIATTRTTVTSVQPGTRVDFETTGFASNDRGLVGCSDIARFERIETTVLRG